tara:strand:+ start:893 stop:1456 length:564 start_codon:yes stop_codon:yes gene_type:complete
MRIISGKNKGKKILFPNDKFTRPLKDLVKESIFNIIDHSNLINIKVKESNILDLFSGVGSFGLECLSRDAKEVTFVENYPNVLNVLNKNILKLGYEKKTNILSEDIFIHKNLANLKKNFDIIFMDPPYKEKKIFNLISDLNNLKILNHKGIFIIHRHKKEKEIYPKNFKILVERSYGISKIIFGNYL